MKHNFTLIKLGVVLSLFCAPAAFAVGTAAATNITNTASATYTDPTGIPKSINSNTITTKVDEVLNVTLVSNNSGNVTVATPQTGVPLSFKVTNTGNGTEPYGLTFNNTVTGSGFNPTNTKLYIDTNNNGVYDPGVDTLYVAGSNDPILPADGSVTVFAVSDVPTGRANGDIGLLGLNTEAVVAKASGSVQPAGYTYIGKGNGGVDAMVGVTQAVGAAQGGYIVSQALTSLVKSQSVSDPFGGTDPVPGATITYTLVFAATGTGSLTNAKVDDLIPANTTYVPGSITLDGVAQTDIIDADGGDFSSGIGINVNLGTVAAPATHTITFRVKIN